MISVVFFDQQMGSAHKMDTKMCVEVGKYATQMLVHPKMLVLLRKITANFLTKNSIIILSTLLTTP